MVSSRVDMNPIPKQLLLCGNPLHPPMSLGCMCWRCGMTYDPAHPIIVRPFGDDSPQTNHDSRLREDRNTVVIIYPDMVTNKLCWNWLKLYRQMCAHVETTKATSCASVDLLIETQTCKVWFQNCIHYSSHMNYSSNLFTRPVPSKATKHEPGPNQPDILQKMTNS